MRRVSLGSILGSIIFLALAAFLYEFYRDDYVRRSTFSIAAVLEQEIVRQLVETGRWVDGHPTDRNTDCMLLENGTVKGFIDPRFYFYPTCSIVSTADNSSQCGLWLVHWNCFVIRMPRAFFEESSIRMLIEAFFLNPCDQSKLTLTEIRNERDSDDFNTYNTIDSYERVLRLYGCSSGRKRDDIPQVFIEIYDRKNATGHFTSVTPVRVS